MKEDTYQQITGFFGLLTPLIALSFIFMAIYFSPTFLVTQDALSKLGIQEGLPSMLFNSALVFSGILLLPIAITIPKFLKYGKPLGAMIFIMSIDLILISIFRVGSPLHFHLAVILFSIFPLVFLYLFYLYIKEEDYSIGKLEVILGISAIAIWIFPWKGYAIPEILGAFIISGWVIDKSIDLLKKE